MIGLYNDDCLKIMAALPDASIDLVATDCPYRLVAGGRVGDKTPRGGIFSEYHEGFKKGGIFAENEIAFSDWLPEVFRVLKDGRHCYIMVNGRNLANLQACAEQVGFGFQNLLVWDKGNKTPNRYYMQQVEFILMLKKGPSRTINNAGTGNLLSFKNPVGNKCHPTEKPVGLMESLIGNSSEPEWVVLDPFMGSGTTGVAAVGLNRHFVGIELDEGYFDVAQTRIKAAEEAKNA